MDFELTNTCSLIRVQLISSIARAHKTANYVSTDLIAPTISRITLITSEHIIELHLVLHLIITHHYIHGCLRLVSTLCHMHSCNCLLCYDRSEHILH